jgi:hypothetical protein
LPGPPFVLSLLAALFFLLIGLEELPVRWNVLRTARMVRRRTRRSGRPAAHVLEDLGRSTRRSAWILLGFAIASSALLVLLRAYARPEAPLPEAVQLFGVTLVLGLLFLAFTFYAWAPRLMALAARELEAETAGSNAAAPFDGQKS